MHTTLPIPALSTSPVADPATPEQTKRDGGFTLIELLVVVVIIGVLAAIAIPIFLNQKDKAAEAGVKSDIKTASTYMETWFVDNATYVGGGANLASTDYKSSNGTTITVPGETADSYCIQAAGSTETVFHLTSVDGAVVPGACP